MKNHINYKLLTSTCLLLCIMCYTQIVQAQGSQTRSTVKIAPNVTTGAWLHLPDDYNQTSDNYPLLIFLHGVGEGASLDAGLAHGVPRIISKGSNMQFTVGGKLFKFIVVSPQIPNGWASETMVQNVIDDIKSRYRVDASRIYLTGLSAGGYGVLNYVASGSNYANNLAAIVPVSAAPIDAVKVDGLCNIASAKIAVWMLCGGADSFVDYLDKYSTKINTCSPTIKPITTVYPGGGHDDGVWDKAYDATHAVQSPNIYEWMLQYQRGGTTTPPPVTTPPVASVALSNIAVTLPQNTAALDGSPSTAPNSTITGYSWSQVSGPGTASIGSAAAAKTSIGNLLAGTYVFKLTVTNAKALTASTNVTVTVKAATAGGGKGSCASCKFLISPGTDGGAYINGNNMNVQPGDTVCIQSGNYAYIQFFNFSGAAGKPIVFINCGGQVKVGNGGNYGIVFNNVKYFKVTGSGSSDKYGFLIDGVVKKLSSGTAIGKGCTDYEAERLEITGSEVGIFAKINPDCDPANQYPNFSIRNVMLHDLYIHDVIGEGMYIGNTAPSGTVVDCDGVSQNLLPPRIYNLKIYNVITENTGWDGIQVASAPENVEIYNNSVYNFGTTNKGSQQAGIILGGQSNGKVYNNKIVKGTGNGIELFGTGLSYIYNNIVVDAGIDGTAIGQDAIFIDDRPTEINYTPLQVYAFNNTVVNSGRDGIRMQNSFGTVAKGNLFYNNLVVHAGSGRGVMDYINVQSGINFLSANNITEPDINVPKFVNAGGKDFHLAAGSTAIDKGKDLSAYFKTDIDGDARPFGTAFDVGADEYTGSAPANKPPAANAGNDFSITLPVNTATLDGSASSDPDGTIASYKWTQVSGPATATFSSNAVAKPGISKLTVAGDYVFQLTVTDNSNATGTDNVTVTVKPAPVYLPPTVSAGNAVTITLPVTTVSLTGTATAAAGSQLATYQWTQLSGPITANINAANALTTGISQLNVAGAYVFQLTVKDDKGMSASASVTVTVKAAIPDNIPPVAKAGNDISITLPVSTTTLDGSASTDPDGTIVTYKWTQTSGPVTATLSSGSAVKPAVSNLTTAGNYVFQLTVTDDRGATANDNVTVTVHPQPVYEPPTVSAGNAVTIMLPVTTATLTGSATAAAGSQLTTYQWTQLSGPVTATISTAAALSTGISQLTTAGDYVFQLTVSDDKGQSASASITVTVNAAVPDNIPPVANAGNNISITLPVSTTTLDGSGSTDPDGTIVTYKWTQTSGPVTATLSSGSAVKPAVSKLTTAGNYVFQLTVTDDKGASSNSDVTITVHPQPVYEPPTVSAGNAVTITLPVTTTTLTGSATAAAGSQLTTYQWTQLSGPVTATINAAAALSTGISQLTTAGDYVFQLTVSDDKGQSASASVTVTVNAAIPDNIPPVANAGNNISITLPVSTTTLDGSGSTDPDGTIVTYKWTQTSGPVTATLSSGSAVKPAVSKLTTAGNYVFQLTVTDDKGASSNSNVTITVHPQPVYEPPTVSAGNAVTITLPVTTATLTGSATAAAGSQLTTYQWTQLSGPVTATINAADALSTGISQLTTAGDYVFQLTVSDDKGQSASASVTVTVKSTPVVNTPPVANAGNDVTITLPVTSSSLDGSASYDPDGNIAGYKWAQISGPVNAVIATTTGVRTNISGLTTAGAYIFELTVTDNQGAAAANRVTITVKPRPASQLIADAGANQSILLSEKTVTLDGSRSSVTNGTIVKYSWELKTGPAGVNIQTPGGVQTAVSFSREGIYVFSLTVTDDTNNSASAVVSVAVKSDPSHNGDVNFFNIFPNPVRDNMSLKLDLINPMSIIVRIFNSNGMLVSNINLGVISGIQRNIDVSALPGGVYLLQVSNGKEFNLNKKFIKVN